jgi:RND superfamily putative drug exporter
VEQRGFDRLVDAIPSRPGGRREVLVMAAFVTPADSVAAVARLQRLIGRGGVRLGGWGALSGGPDIAFHELDALTSRDVAHVERWALPWLALLCFLFFGGIAALLPALVGGMAILVALAVLRLLAELGVAISIYCLPAVLGIGLGLGIDYCRLMLGRYREEADLGVQRVEAVRRMCGTAGRTVLASAVTIALVLAALAVFPLGFLAGTGLAVGITALAAGATAWLLLPRLFLRFGPRIIRRRVGRTWGRRAWQQLARWVTGHPMPVVVLAVVVLLALAAPVAGLRLVAPSAQLLPPSAQSRIVERTLAHDTTVNPMGAMYTIYRPRAHGLPVGRLVGREARIAAGGAEMLPARYLGAGTWDVSLLPYGDPDSPANQTLLDRLRAGTASTGALIGGFTAFMVDQRAAIAARLPIAVLVLLLVAAAVLSLISGSLVIAVKGIVMAALTVAAGIGVLVAVFGALEEANLVFMAGITLALSIDYELFLVSRIREERDHGLSNRQAIETGLVRTGPMISTAATLFVAATGVFAFASIFFARQFGVGAAATVAIDASLVRILLMPSLMVLLGKWNWYAPGPLRALHSRLIKATADPRHRPATPTTADRVRGAA